MDQILVTIAPGKTLEWLADQFGKPLKIIRTMPNTPGDGKGRHDGYVSQRKRNG